VGKKNFLRIRSNVNTGSLNWEDRQKLKMENDFEFDELSGYYFSFGMSQRLDLRAARYMDRRGIVQ
jgi:hypothetical protein